MELRGRADHGEHRVAIRERSGFSHHRSVGRGFFPIVRSMIGASAASSSTPRMPRRSTTVAAPPPVVVTTRDARRTRQIRRFAPRQQRADLEQRFQHVDAHDAAIAEVRVERGVAAGERAGVRAREPPRRATSARACRRPSGLPAACAARAPRASRAASRTVSRNSTIDARRRVARRAARPARPRRRRPRCRPRPAWRSPGRAPRRARAACRAWCRSATRCWSPPAGSASISSTAFTLTREAAAHVDHAHAVRPEQAHAERARARDQPRLALHAFGDRRRRSRR